MKHNKEYNNLIYKTKTIEYFNLNTKSKNLYYIYLVKDFFTIKLIIPNTNYVLPNNNIRHILYNKIFHKIKIPYCCKLIL